MFILRDRQCLITGAASGIGRATALAVAARGGRLVLTDLRADALEQVAGEVRAAGGTVLEARAADITSHEEVAALAEAVHAEHGAMDVVMNVAGIATWGTVDRLEHHHWRQVVEVNLMGPIHVIESFVPAMIEAGRGGALVNVSSAAGLIGLPWHAPYSATKFGLRGISEVLRFDLRPHDIAVTLVCPGAVATPLVDTVQIVGIDKEHPAVRKMTERFRRHASTPEEVAEMIVKGVERRRYLVITARDVKLAHLAQRYFPPAYERAMRKLNKQMSAVGRAAGLP